ncbi:MAG: ABC transporter permease [Devosiaceae bacterium]|nr:ABC transporter permease [Devosiaceae bacterium]
MVEMKQQYSKPTPIVPAKSVSGRTLMLLIAIMTFLCAVTLGGVILIQKSALAWSQDVGREVTIQISPVEGELMDANLRLAETIAEATKGVANARALSIEESEDLLKPWLGEGLDLTELNIPRLIIVRLSDPVNADLETLENELKIIKGASLDRHDVWRTQLNSMAGTIVFSGVLGLVLIILATLLATVFATRGAMATNREIVDVLHFIGASNKFVAKEFQGRFLKIGFRGALIGAIFALIFFVLMGALSSNILPNSSSEQISILFGTFSLGIIGIFWILMLVPIIAGLTAFTSRMTVKRFLSQITW